MRSMILAIGLCSYIAIAVLATRGIENTVRWRERDFRCDAIVAADRMRRAVSKGV